MNATQHFGYFTGSNNEYTISKPTTVAYSADWFHLNTCLTMEYALTQITRLLDTWKKQFLHECQSHSSRFYVIKP